MKKITDFWVKSIKKASIFFYPEHLGNKRNGLGWVMMQFLKIYTAALLLMGLIFFLV